MRFKSMSKDLQGTVKEVLGTAFSVGCLVDGKSPKTISEGIDDGSIEGRYSRVPGDDSTNVSSTGFVAVGALCKAIRVTTSSTLSSRSFYWCPLLLGTSRTLPTLWP